MSLLLGAHESQVEVQQLKQELLNKQQVQYYNVMSFSNRYTTDFAMMMMVMLLLLLLLILSPPIDDM